MRLGPQTVRNAESLTGRNEPVPPAIDLRISTPMPVGGNVTSAPSMRSADGYTKPSCRRFAPRFWRGPIRVHSVPISICRAAPHGDSVPVLESPTVDGGRFPRETARVHLRLNSGRRKLRSAPNRIPYSVAPRCIDCQQRSSLAGVVCRPDLIRSPPAIKRRIRRRLSSLTACIVKLGDLARVFRTSSKLLGSFTD